MTEPDVALTDFALGIECAVFAYLLLRRSRGRLRGWFATFFGTVSAAAVLGGTSHGFFASPEVPGHTLVWTATMLAIGATAFSQWVIGATLMLSRRAVRWVSMAASVPLALYAALVLLVTVEYWLAILAYFPAALFLLTSSCVAYRRRKERGLLWIALGLVASLVGSALQHFRVAVHSVYFTHNALYHVIQAGALLTVFWGARTVTDSANES